MSPLGKGAIPRDGFGGLARMYRTLEFAAFGGDLERARFCFLDRLRNCHDILLLGEGDGRNAFRIASLAPEARLLYLDASPGMSAAAERRLAPFRDRVTFLRADARTCDLALHAFDAVTTPFFLDCFTEAEAEPVVARVTAAMQPKALWLFADFVLPAAGWRRWRAKAWLVGLYAFFRWRTRLSARALPPSEAILLAAGWRLEAAQEFQGGLVRSAVFSRPGAQR